MVAGSSFGKKWVAYPPLRTRGRGLSPATGWGHAAARMWQRSHRSTGLQGTTTSISVLPQVTSSTPAMRLSQ
jgi:hypothetical protein